MTQRKSYILLNANTTAQTTDPLSLDYRFDANPTRAIGGTLTAGDSVILQVSPNVTAATPDVWVTVATYTSTTFADVFHGPFPRLRVQKTGANGAATCYIVG
jgi:hypothetical protein